MPPRPRIRIQAYGISESAKNISQYLGIKRIKQSNSRFVARPTDIIINWGKPKQILNARYLNSLAGINIATCKLKTLQTLSAASISVPEFTTTKPTEGKWVARTLLNSHSGQGAEVAEAADLPNAPLYTKYIQKDAEYRVIVVGSEAVDTKQKLKRRDFEGERRPYIWSCDNGYIFSRNVDIPVHVKQLGIEAVATLGLKYAAVDIITKGDQAYVLELNTAFGAEGTTVELVGEALKVLIQ